MAQMQTVSIRIPDEDFQWLLAIEDHAARTPSEKLRALLARVRQQEIGMDNPGSCLAWLRGLTQPFNDALANLERQQKKHSDLVSAVAEMTPRIMATLITSRPDDKQIAIEIEAVLAQQCFRLLTALLRSAITSNPSTYDNGVHSRYLPDIIELAQIISSTQEKEPNHV